jgi:hypothetical protein
MLVTIPRDTFQALVRIKSTTLDQRVRTGEAAFALGIEKRPHTGEYLYLDAVAMILASMINCFTGLELKRAADIVRETWDGDDGWLTLLTKAERFPLPNHAEQFVCVAWTSLDRSEPRHIVMGEHHEITAALRGQTVAAPCFISMHFLLRCLRGNAKLAGIRLPPRLTIAEGEPGFKEWRTEIDLYRQYANARVKRLQKA